jgi:hypothetical protein
MASEKTGSGYVPTDVDAAVPTDPAARRARTEELEDITTRRDVLLGRIARLRAALTAAQTAGDAAREAELRRRIAELSAERDAL